MDAALQACAWAREAGVAVVADAEVHHERMAELLERCDVIIPSEDFACEATAASDYRDAARAMFDRHAQSSPRPVVVVTAGTRGCFGVSRAGEFHQPAFRVPVVDTTGCGDVFHGAFIYAMCQGWDLPRCAQLASATAALKCRRLGGRAGIPTRVEVDAFLASGPATYPAG
jgi:ribokinase